MSNLIQKLIDKYESFKRNRKYKQNRDFVIVKDHPNFLGLVPIKLTSGKYSGTMYHYNPIRVGEDLGEKGSMATFSVTVIEYHNLPENFLAEEEFQKTVADILLILMEQIAQDKINLEKVTPYEEDREDYTEEFVQRRTVRPKSSPVSEE